MIVDKCNESCNVVDDLSKTGLPSETIINVKVFNMITRRNKATLIKHASYDCKCKLDGTTCNSSQK